MNKCSACGKIHARHVMTKEILDLYKKFKEELEEDKRQLYMVKISKIFVETLSCTDTLSPNEIHELVHEVKVAKEAWHESILQLGRGVIGWIDDTEMDAIEAEMLNKPSEENESILNYKKSN